MCRCSTNYLFSLFQFDVSQIKASSGKLKPDRLEEFNRLDIQRLLQNPNEELVLIEQLRKLIRDAVLAK